LYKPDSVIHYAKLSIIDNADNAMVKFAGTNIGATNNFFGPLRNNLIGTGVTNPTAIRQGEYIANLMNGTNPAFQDVEDPRAIYMLRLNSNNTFKGVPSTRGQNVLDVLDRPENFWGTSQNPNANNTSVGNTQRYIFRNDAPFPIMTASEIHFLIAEASLLKGDRAQSLTAHREGIRQNIEMLRTTFATNVPVNRVITPAIRDAFLANPNIVPASANSLTLSKIMLQKYIALFGHGALETWVDMRRYHYTDTDRFGSGQVYTAFVPGGGNLFPDNNGEYIYRYYPRFNAEYVWNINELKRIGATDLNYHSKPSEKIWFALP